MLTCDFLGKTTDGNCAYFDDRSGYPAIVKRGHTCQPCLHSSEVPKTMVVFKTTLHRTTTIALFPCQEKWTGSHYNDTTVESYWPNLDSFSEASVLFVRIAYKKATEQEAAPVKAALEGKGYNLEVRRRMPTKSERDRWLQAGNN